jgi:hypothetical protein
MITIQVLQKRDTAQLEGCKEYLHFLMKGLESLPSYNPQGVLWRGVNRQIPYNCFFLLHTTLNMS